MLEWRFAFGTYRPFDIPWPRTIPAIRARRSEEGRSMSAMRTMRRGRSVALPKPGSRELQEMAVGIAEVNGTATAGPIRAALDDDGMTSEMRLPFRKLCSLDREGDMKWAGTVMGRNRAAGSLDGFQRPPADKEQQRAAPGDIIGAHPTIGMKDRQAHDSLVESCRTIQIVDVEHGFEDGGQRRHSVMLRGGRPPGQPAGDKSVKTARAKWQVLAGGGADRAKIQLPVIAYGLCAGFPSPADDHLDETINLNHLLVARTPATFLWRVYGESMLDAGVYHGDLLVGDRCPDPQNGDVVVATVHRERSL